MTQIQFDTNQVPYQEERISNFIEADEDELEAGNEPDITLSIRKYPKRYIIGWEVIDCWDIPYDPINAEDTSRCYIPPKVYVFPQKYLHQEFAQHREQILRSIKSKLQQRYRKFK